MRFCHGILANTSRKAISAVRTVLTAEIAEESERVNGSQATVVQWRPSQLGRYCMLIAVTVTVRSFELFYSDFNLKVGNSCIFIA